MVMKNLGAKSLLASIPVFVVALIAHFVDFGIRLGISEGLVGGLLSAIGLVIVSLIATAIFTFATAKKEGMTTGFIMFLTFLIIVGIVSRLITTIPALQRFFI